MRKNHLVLWLVAGLAVLLLACETAAVIQYMVGGQNRPSSTRRATAEPGTNPTRSPGDPYAWVPVSVPRCSVGDPTASQVSGSIVENGRPVVGQRVMASTAPGGEPLSDELYLSDENGNFQLTFICGGGACDGAFWVWVVNDNLEQVSPFVQFNFDNQCRRGIVDFSNP